ncbi:hypothetical protein VNO80_08090 [Phaseolus coccineus]|uniref:Uncharacterized protein n=1 Tax=Phaseolus coccineus TaxID=3886 RepID=A0AAN9NPX1_PHACN
MECALFDRFDLLNWKRGEVRYSHEGVTCNQASFSLVVCGTRVVPGQPHKFLSFILNLTKQTPDHMGFGTPF